MGNINHFGWPLPDDEFEDSIFRPEDGLKTINNPKSENAEKADEIFRSEHDSEWMNNNKPKKQ